MKRRSRGLTTKRATCPECGAVVTWRQQAGLRRFQPRIKNCEDCGEVWR